MSKLKRIIITPFFGELPSWFDKYEPPVGYDFILDTDLDKFKQRVSDILKIKCPIVSGSGKPWDYRPTLGLLYADEIKGFDFWGHTDLDCVYGDVNKFFPDEILSTLDIWSNHDTYVAGFWTLYRNSDMVNSIFMWEQTWKDYLTEPEPNAWVENRYSRLIESSGLRYKYSHMQGNPYTTTPNLRKINGKLYQLHGAEKNNEGYTEEIPIFHFRRSKKWPL